MPSALLILSDTVMAIQALELLRLPVREVVTIGAVFRTAQNGVLFRKSAGRSLRAAGKGNQENQSPQVTGLSERSKLHNSPPVGELAPRSKILSCDAAFDRLLLLPILHFSSFRYLRTVAGLGK
jgi:hypothetical protein